MVFRKYQKSLFVFRRDLRLEDNLGLISALENSQEVLTAFIFDPRQIKDNAYFSAPAFEFMLQSLEELSDELRKKESQLYIFKGKAHEQIAKLIDQEGFSAVFINKDYSPFSVERDLIIAEVCRQKGIAFESVDDALLNNPGAVNKADGGIYTIFTPYFRKASQIPVALPRQTKAGKFFAVLKGKNKSLALDEFKLRTESSWIIQGGRFAALAILKDLAQQKDYLAIRDIPALDATTHLSSHLKFGTCSVREVHASIKKALGINHPLIRQLYWRDFFVQIGYHHPYVLGRAFHEKYDKIVWGNNLQKFASWCAGNTGFPIVDAGMRQLNTTGFMHNRLRMVTASFLVKDLHVDWRWGEKYFAQKLVDYDPLVNNGNWQWAASTGCDAQPYFRIFSPARQQERFDPECLYIKKWLPELKNLTIQQIHRLGQEPLLCPPNYFPPIIDHKIASETAKKLYRAC